MRENLEFMRDMLERLGPEALSSAARPLPSPESVPGYQLVRELARGGQGAVYEAVQLDTRRRVALKVIETGEPGRSARRRLEREAELAASLRHPAIVSIYHVQPMPDGRLALAMEYVDGVTLDEWASKVDAGAGPGLAAHRQAVRLKVRALAAVCEAVHHAHVNGVIHRDLKPANVLVTPSGAVRVVDFGIARRVSPTTQVTRTGSFAGTLAYASPEQVSGKPDAVDIRTDVYSLGLMLYELLAGRRPYETDGSLTGAVANIVSLTPPPLSRLQPGDQPAGAELEAIVARSLAKDPAERYQSAAALQADLENWLAGRAVEARQHSTVYVLRKLAARHRVGFAAALGLLILLTAFAAAMTWSSRRLAHQRTLLAHALSSSTIERGRSVGRSGENARAEALLWPELLRAGGDPADPDLLFHSNPLATQAAWALAELYSRHPSVLHTAALPGGQPVRFEPGDQAVRLLRSDGAAEVRDARTGRLLHLTPPHAPPAPSDRMVISGTRFTIVLRPDRTLLVDHDGALSREIPPARLEQAMPVDVSADGTRLLVLSPERRLSLWSTDPFEPIAHLADEVAWYARPVFSPDGTLVLSGVSGVVRTWRASDGMPDRAWTLPAGLHISDERIGIGPVRLSRDGRRLAVGVASTLLLYDADDPATPPLERRGAHRGFISILAFSDDASVLLSHGSERNSVFWDSRTGQILSSFEHGQPLRGIPILSRDGSLAAACDEDDRLRVFATRSGEWRRMLTSARDTVHRVAYSPDGGRLAAVASDGRVRVWSTADAFNVEETPPPARSLEALAWFPDGRRLAVAGPDGLIHVLRPDASLTPLARGPERPTWLGVSPDGRLLAATGAAQHVALLDADQGTPVGLLHGHAARVIEGVFTTDGLTLYTVGADGVCIAWDPHARAERFRTAGVGTLTRAVAISEREGLLATGSDDWKIRLWDAHTGALRHTISGLRQQVFGLAFHPAGNLLFSCGRDRLVQVWDIRTGREIAQLEGHQDLVMSLALAPDGRTLATASADHAVGVWDLAYFNRRLPANAHPWRTRATGR